MSNLTLLPPREAALRRERLAGALRLSGADALLVTANATKYYLTGRVFAGWMVVDARTAEATAFVQRPVDVEGPDVVHVRKPEEIRLPAGVSRLGIEGAALSVAMWERLRKALSGCEVVDASATLRAVRAVKTPYEIEQVRLSGLRHEKVYRAIPSLYAPDMTDVELQVEIERALRLEGCLGQFRIAGDSMELFMGNILVGDNADTPSPYDFAMGGGGMHPSLPVGADGRVIREGDTVMVDANGNFTGYMTDMTRTFRLGDIAPEAERAHRLSIDICRAVAAAGRPGTEAKALYELAAGMAAEAGLADYFMGHRQKAGFVGHGVGIEVNEAPVLAPRSRDILAEGNVIAVEPKFVIPGTGAVGVENTYAVTPDGMVCLTNAPENILPL